jgi:FkbM family methyltransferase
MPNKDSFLIVGDRPLGFRIAVIWQQIKNFSRTLRFYWKSLSPPQRTKLGFYFCGNRKMLDGRYEPDETRFLESALPGVDQFINIGANTGYYCCLALSKDKPVLAFEPNDLNVKHLLANVCLNGWGQKIEVFPLALSDGTGIAELFGAGSGASFIRGWANNPDRHVSLAPVSSVDRILTDSQLSQRTLVLMDVEGAEGIVLSGADRLINAEPKPLWLIEISILSHRPGGSVVNPSLKSIFQRFWDTGYDAWLVREPSRMVTPEMIDGILSSGEIPFQGNNFIFAERGLRAETGWAIQ